MMISARKLTKMARKWQKMAAIKRKRLSLSLPTATNIDEVSTSSQVVEKKGHFIAYTTDKVRFAFPIAYLNTFIFRELLTMSEQEFGLPSHGPITLPCDSKFMGYVASLIQKKAAKDVEKALLLSMAPCRSPSSNNLHLHPQLTNHFMLLRL